MRNFLPYISALVAFLAAFIAIVGKPKWDAKQRGFRRLTDSGRAAAALSIIALVSTMALTRSAQVAAEAQRKQREDIRELAHTELRLAIQELAEPFVGVLVSMRRGFAMDLDLPVSRASGKPFPACMLDPQDYTLLVAATMPATEGARQPSTKELLADPALLRLYNGEAHRYSMRAQIKRDATDAALVLDRTLATYAAYLEPKILYLVAELRRSRWLWQLQNLGPQMPVDFGLLDGRFRRDDDLGYQRFWRIVQELWNDEDGLLRDRSNQELWGPDHPLMKQLRADPQIH